VDTWIRVSGSGFISPDDEHFDSFYESSRRVALHPRMTCFLAELRGRVVGAAGIEVACPVPSLEPTSCLLATSVLPDYRRRGIQLALIAARLARAASLGARWAVIQSKPHVATERNARRLGFETAYTKCVMVLRREGLVESP
jgi:GNAT superfamily N-acetyltransferase